MTKSVLAHSNPSSASQGYLGLNLNYKLFLPDNRMQRTALRAAADAERWPRFERRTGDGKMQLQELSQSG